MYENEIYSGNSTENNEGRYFDRLDNPGDTINRQKQNAWQADPVRPIPEEPVKTSKKRGGFLKKTIVALSMGLCFGVFAGLGFFAVCKTTGILEQISVSNQAALEIADNGNGVMNIPQEKQEIKNTTPQSVNMGATDISGVVEEVMPAMVSIINNATERMDFWGQTYTRESASSGTGIIISENEEELLIATNHHVAVDSTKLEVTFIDGATAEAKIKGMDSEMDLAVIAVKLKDVSNETKAAISIATLGDSDDLKLGKPVIVIGNALGYGQSVTNGIISGLNRELEMEDGTTGTFIQTNAAVNPGNSGGALFNINGEVIGIVSSKIGGSAIEGMGYAIPISSASPIISEMLERRTREDKVAEGDMGYLGITPQQITAEAVQYYNMPQGVFIYKVYPGTGAEAAGIMNGDIITRLEGERITSFEDLQDVLQYYAVGDTITVTISRWENGGYTSMNVEVTLGERPKD
ncbi:MAG: trypsin-like peptidase domain-containing protein [Roseburia sp.]|nr:trypsin-like peptidase domain-containing protein [Roseburia sp.]